MRTIEIIQSEIDNTNRLLEMAKAHNDHLTEVYEEAKNIFIEELKAALVKDGIKYHIRSFDLRNYYGDSGTRVGLYFTVDENQGFGSDFTVDLVLKDDGTRLVTRLNSSGISCTPNRNENTLSEKDIEDYSKYYRMIGEITSKIGNLENFWNKLATFKKPDLDKYLSTRDLNQKISELETEMKVASIPMTIGAEVEIFVKGSGRWCRDAWVTRKIEKITPKVVVVVDTYGDRKQIKKEEISWRMRAPKAA